MNQVNGVLFCELFSKNIVCENKFVHYDRHKTPNGTGISILMVVINAQPRHSQSEAAVKYNLYWQGLLRDLGSWQFIRDDVWGICRCDEPGKCAVQTGVYCDEPATNKQPAEDDLRPEILAPMLATRIMCFGPCFTKI